MSIKKDEIFEKVTEKIDPLTGEKIEEKEKFVYRYDKDTGEKLEKKVIDTEESFDPLTGEKIIKAITEDDILEKQEINQSIKNEPVQEVAKEENKEENKKEGIQLSDAINTNMPKKNKMPLFIGIIVIVGIISIVAFALNKFTQDPHIKVGMAIKNTVDKSIEEIDNVFGLTQFSQIIQDGNFTAGVGITEATLGIGGEVNLALKNSSEFKVDMKVLGMDIFDIFADKTDLYLQSQYISEDIYKVNYEKLDKKLDELIENGDFSESEIEYLRQAKKYIYNYSEYVKIINQFYKNVDVRILKSLKDLEYEEIKDSDFEAYRFNFKPKEIGNILQAFLDEIESNKEFKELLVLYIFLNEGYYDTIQEAEEDLNDQLEYAREDIRKFVESYSAGHTIMSADVYLSGNYVKKANFILYDELESVEISVSFNDENYSLLNMNIDLKVDEEMASISTVGENTDEKFKLGLKIEDEYDILGFNFIYDKNTNDIAITDLDEIYILEGKINKLDPGKEIDFYFNIPVDYSEIKLGFKLSDNVENINKPEGNVIDALELTEEDIENIIDDVYQKLGHLM